MDYDVNAAVSENIFRAYDIRGIAHDTLTTDVAYLIGRAIGSVLRESQGKKILLARDGRVSGPVLIKALSDGLRAVGCDVYDLGMMPTPILYYATKHFPERSGIMLTGSHNPPNYNGMKIVINGQTLAEEAITGLYQKIQTQDFYQDTPGTHEALQLDTAYLQDISSNIALKKSLKVVVDAGNGVTGIVGPALFKLLGCQVVELFCEIDGTFPNHHPDPSDMENLAPLIERVKAEQADIGFAFDGDGDRLGVVTNRGEIILPDRLLMLFASALLAKTPQAKILYDVKCTSHLETVIKAQAGEPIMWKTGHSLIKVKMAEINAALGGEMSGHFFFRDRWNGFDDALYAGARLLEILAESVKTSSEVFAEIPNSINTPELKVQVSEEEKFSLMEALRASAHFAEAKSVITIDGLRVNFAEGWGLVRASNTSPYLVLRFEAKDETILASIQDLFKHWLLSVEPKLALPF